MSGAEKVSPARRAALLRLLEDWEAGRMTETYPVQAVLPPDERLHFLRAQIIAVGLPGRYTLTPMGLSAARQAREDANG